MSFSFSKIFWFIFNPGNLVVLGLAVGILAVFMPGHRTRRFGRGVLAFMLGAILALAVLPIGPWLVGPLEERFAAPAAMPNRVDGVIVLGGAFSLKRSAARRTAQLNEYADRMVAFAALARRYPAARLVFSGGSGDLLDQESRESDFAAGLMADLGIAPERIVFERDSRNTYENALYAKRLAKPQPGEVWLLVTSAFHMPRAMGVFRMARWTVVPYPVDYQTQGPGQAGLGFDFAGGLRLATLGLHEWIGLAAYRAFGWSTSFYPAPSGQ